MIPAPLRVVPFGLRQNVAPVCATLSRDSGGSSSKLLRSLGQGHWPKSCSGMASNYLLLMMDTEAIAAIESPARMCRPGLVYSFLPAHGDSKVGAVQSRLIRTWTEDLGFSVLLVGFEPQSLSVWESAGPVARLDAEIAGGYLRPEPWGGVLDASAVRSRFLPRLLVKAAERYGIVAVDLTAAREMQSVAAIRASEATFFVSDSDTPSLEMVREKVRWMEYRSIGVACGVLLRRVQGGMRPDLAEDVTSIPVCGLVGEGAPVEQVARWLASDPEVRVAAAG